jgi:hypothetical protein
VDWFPQFKRNLHNYQEGHGILLLPVPDEQDRYLATGNWNSLKLLNQEYFDDSFDIPTHLLESTYLSLQYDFDANILEFLYVKKTTKFHVIKTFGILDHLQIT